MTPEFRINLRLSNNRLRKLREAENLSAPKLAAKIGVAYEGYVALENLHATPRGRQGGWRPIALRIAEYFGVLPEYLWPPIVRAVKSPTTTIEANAAQVIALARHEQERLELASPEEAVYSDERADVISRIVEGLPPREAKVIALTFGLGSGREHTLREVSHVIGGVTVERVRQLQDRALRMLRLRLQDALPDEEWMSPMPEEEKTER